MQLLVISEEVNMVDQMPSLGIITASSDCVFIFASSENRRQYQVPVKTRVCDGV
tara:strand:+ start:802 stop:963 length:162 start_codon:yes stop_codon:yes gene_type:complete